MAVEGLNGVLVSYMMRADVVQRGGDAFATSVDPGLDQTVY